MEASPPRQLTSDSPALSLDHPRHLGVRFYLAIAFAGVALIAAGLAYLLVSAETGQEAATDSLESIGLGRAYQLAADVSGIDEEPDCATTSPAGASGCKPKDRNREIQQSVEQGVGPDDSAWVYTNPDQRITNSMSNIDVTELPADDKDEAIAAALHNEASDSFSYRDADPPASLVAVPVRLTDGAKPAALLYYTERPPELQEALNAVRGDRLTALGIAVAVAVLISFLIASAITTRIKRLAVSAGRISQGYLDEPLEGTGGRDEITDLGQALERMRVALRETFDALRAERDRLSAIFDALSDAVMVVDADGLVRFSNPAAEPLVYADGKVAASLLPWMRRAARMGSSEQDGLRIGERVYAIQAREIPAEGAVLAVVRDRTEELKREIAERDFVSNAAHELRNPIAAISGAVEVLRDGAKDDPGAREHFLGRLGEDTDRIKRLTDSLLTLARMEAVGEGGTEALDVGLTAEDAVAAVVAPEGIDLRVDLEPDLTAQADRVLLRQVLIGLLTNAFKHTPPPGVVTLRAIRTDDAGILIEVSDTGTGIPADEVDRIFERFYRGAGTLEKEGFGLGLSIARRMVDVMGGELGVDSVRGEGSRFWVRLRASAPVRTPVA